MTSTTIFSCFLVLLAILPIFGRNIVNDYDHVFETSVKQMLSTDMNIHDYNNLVINYWTPERMKSAEPMNLLPVNEASDFETVNRSTLTVDNKRTSHELNIPGVLPKSLTASPPVIGKLFVTFDSMDYTCTASVVVSENGDTVFTMIQCILDVESQTWANNAMFVPGYSNGFTPYGAWVWRVMAAMGRWVQYQDRNYALGIVLVEPSTTGEHVQSVTGSLGLTINATKKAQTIAYGYSWNVQQDEVLVNCSGLTAPASIPQLPDFQGLAFSCNLSNGSAGGPWIQNGSYQSSINSFTLTSQSDVMFGIYFGDAVFSFWNQYQRRQSFQ